jgi:hypothetical protein
VLLNKWHNKARWCGAEHCQGTREVRLLTAND